MYFKFFWIRSIQSGSNLIKLDFSPIKNVTKQVVTFTERIKLAVFLIFFDQIYPKWIKLDLIGFPHQSKNVPIKSCHIYRKAKNGCFIFDFFVIRSVQNGSNLLKLDFSLIKKVTIISCHICRKDKNGCFVYDFFWIRSAQNGSNNCHFRRKLPQFYASV